MIIFIYLMYKCQFQSFILIGLFTSRAEPNRTDLCSCLARLQTEPSGAAHLKPSLKSSERFSSSKYSERVPSEVRAIWTTVSTD
ncbi:hypothetical protein HanPSC8_Chr14g0615391 [Helianthus annuus]|nr:hypothetical protein HanPSC8_Chr14g0615391 [Helianthus annuus]